MFKNDFKERLKKFLSVLEVEKDSFHTQINNEVFDECLYLINVILSKVNNDVEKEFLENEFLRLSRLVSDSLPWNETILVTWDNVNKQWLQWK